MMTASLMPSADTSFFGHPRGLSTLFFTEMWERFSYYGMRAILVLYMTAAVADGGLGFDVAMAGTLYGAYTSLAYLASLPGGWIADRFLGQQNAIFWGGIAITIGQFVLMLPGRAAFFGGLLIIAAGTGLLKANASAVVGQLYSPGDRRRDAGFSIFYMGVNLGAMISPIICGYLGQVIDYRLGFGAAGVGMILGLIQYQYGRRHLGTAGLEPPARQSAQSGEAPRTPDESKRLLALGILIIASAIFWSLFEQAGSTLNLFALDKTRNEIGGWQFPSSWFQSLNSIFLLAIAPLLAWLWIRLGERDPGPVVKFTLGLLLAGLGFLVLVPGAAATEGGDRVSPLWLTATYLLHTIGELCLSPVGLSATTKLAPARAAGFAMGVWFLSISAGNFLGGQLAGLYASMNLAELFHAVGLAGIAAAAVLLAFNGPITRLMRGVR
jgi:POT family proton-dependent oligopeptide transporter